jgi:glyoxylase-like metal-dependent hydrolase (beta-lactamase superfamily II)
MTGKALLERVERPQSGGAVEIVRGLIWVRMPLPYALNHVNLWLLDDGDGWTLVDTGHGDDPTRAAWDALSPCLRGRPIRRVIATHHHPDHIGLSGWMAKRWGTELWCTRTEWLYGQVYKRPLRELRAAARPHYLRAGIPAADMEPLVERCRSYPDAVTLPPTFRRLRDGEEFLAGGTRWRVVVGGGHAPEHACLLDLERGFFISGDQVLPDITPNVSIGPSEPEDDPLAEFLRTLDTLRSLPEDTVVLPSHGKPFVGLPRRCRELALHHQARLDAVFAACSRPRTAFEVMGVLFERVLDPHQTMFAIGEAFSHLNHLVAQGRLRCERPKRGPYRYVQTVRDASAGADGG